MVDIPTNGPAANSSIILPNAFENVAEISNEMQLNFLGYICLVDYANVNMINFIDIMWYAQRGSIPKSFRFSQAFDNIRSTSQNWLNMSILKQDVKSEMYLNIPSSAGLVLGHLNICHILPNKIEQIRQILLSNKEINIFGLTETFLKPRTHNNLVYCKGFKTERRDRGKNSKKNGGGGALIYVADYIPYIRRIDLESQEIECLWIEINLPHTEPILVCTVYRPKSDIAWITHFESMIENCQSENKEMIIMGDFNLDLFKQQTHWMSSVTALQLSQLITSATRVTKTTSTLLDHVYTNSPQNVHSTHVPKIGLSDHFPTFVVRKLKKEHVCKRGHTSITYRSMKHFNEAEFLQDLRNMTWDDIKVCPEPHQALNIFETKLINAINANAPLKTKRVKRPQQPKWLNEDINSARKLRDQYKSKQMEDEYKYWRNITTSRIHKAKVNHFQNELEKNKQNPQSIWKIVKELNPQTESSQPNSILENDKLLNDPESIAKCFNSFFSEIYQTLSKSSVAQNTENYLAKTKIHVDSLLPENIQFYIPLISGKFVSSELKNMKVKKSTGLDNISAKFLKMAEPIIFTPICEIINISIKTGIFPDQWKMAKVIPIPKTGNLQDPNNYRPISILPIISKIAERHIFNSLYKYLSKYNLLYKLQSGFRKYHSCETALIRIIDAWLEAIDNNKINTAILIDFRKAFDLVDHKILLQKLECYRINGTNLSWFKSYLQDRFQKVSIGGVLSSPAKVESGVPQGSILGPLLFLIFLNDLPLSLTSCEIDLYADDSTLHTSHSNLEIVNTQLNADFREICNWCDANNMIINSKKTMVLATGTRNKRQNCDQIIKISHNNETLKLTNSVKLLGIQLDSNLNWDNHINSICNKISALLSIMYHNRHFMNRTTKLLFYNSYILPHFDFCSSVWGNTTKHNLDRLLKLQKYAARSILNAHPRTPTINLFDQLKWIPITKRIQFRKCTMMYKSLNELTPDYLRQKFKKCNELTRGVTLRSTNTNKLYVPRAKTTYYARSFHVTTANLWNALPNDITSAPSVHSFKKQLMDHYMI